MNSLQSRTHSCPEGRGWLLNYIWQEAVGWETFWAPRQALSRRNNLSRRLPVTFMGSVDSPWGIWVAFRRGGGQQTGSWALFGFHWPLHQWISWTNLFPVENCASFCYTHAIHTSCNVCMQQKNRHILHLSVQSTSYVYNRHNPWKPPAKPSSLLPALLQIEAETQLFA